jgi:hexosaminidase
LTPGHYTHISGDEASVTKPMDYVNFIERIQKIVNSHGKHLIGWEEVAQSQIESNSIVQHWRNNSMA